MNERIQKIRKVASDRNDAALQELLKKEQHLKDMLAQVKALAPRMHELMEIANALFENGIPLGSKGGYLEPSTDFVSNWWSHKVGFIADINGQNACTKPRGFGIMGGGACGDNLCFDQDGNPANVYRDGVRCAGVGKGWDDSDIWHLERFLKGFDEFEKGFYKYVDELK